MTAVLLSSPSHAEDALKFGAAPSWVVPAEVPASSKSISADAPIAILLSDQQITFERGKIASYSHTAMKIQTAQGLAAGNILIPWNPATDTVTVHKLHVLRDGQVIDVLASGQTFTTLRREANLESAVLDGRLTATLQPEGLREGDVIVLAATVERTDPVMKGHVESIFANWNGVPVVSGRARLTWPKTVPITIKLHAGVPNIRPTLRDGNYVLELAQTDIEPLQPPKDAPPRFALGRLGEASDFTSWSAIADLMRPLYREAAVVPSAGPLREELERIRREATDSEARAGKVLALVQDRVRYLALAMGEGGYVPATAESTWARRFGDCKAKTALLLALLRELGIDAEPVLVSSSLGDGLNEHLPMMSLFDHILVRARISGKSYWLDGTRTGDTRLADIQVPNFRWGLPLTEHANLVPMVPLPLTIPTVERTIEIDARSGIYAPAAVKFTEIYRGDAAIVFNAAYSQFTAAQKDELLRQVAKKFVDTISVKSSSAAFEKTKRELRIAVEGEAKLDWDGGWFRVPSSSIAYEPDFERKGAGFDAPIAIAYPDFTKRHVSVRLPAGFLSRQKKPPAKVNETLAGVEYLREVAFQSDMLLVESSERSLFPEVAYKQALADAARLQAVSNEDVYLRVPGDYRATAADLQSKLSEKPASAESYLDRGKLMLDRGRYAESISDFDQALRLDPDNSTALANRGIARVAMRDVVQAEKDFAAASLIKADSAVVFRGRALIAEFNGQAPKAIELYSKSLEIDPGNTFAMVRRATLLRSLGKVDDAIRGLDEGVRRFPKDEFIVANRALFHLGRKDFEAAERDVATALELNGDSLVGHIAQAAIAEAKGDHAAEVAILSKVIQRAADHAPSIEKRALAYRALRKDDLALADSEVALRMVPTSSDMRLMRANIFLGRNDREAAAREAQLLMSSVPQSDYALVAAGKIFHELGHQPEAMKAFDRALALKPNALVYVNRAQIRPASDFRNRLADIEAAEKLEPDNPDVLEAKADLLSETGDFGGARRIYEQALKVEAQDPGLRIGHAVATFKSGDKGTAEAALTKLRSEMKGAGALNRLCWVKATAGILLESAIEDCRMALSESPDTPAYLDSLALALFRLGKNRESLETYDRAIRLKPMAASHMGRALVHASLGDKARAAKDRAEALRLDPDVEATFAGYGLKIEN